MEGLTVKVVKKFTLPGTIDGHVPVGATFLIQHPNGRFRLTVITVNWGRGYKPGEFKRNVLNVLDAVEDKQYVVLLIQELDEVDAAPEHKIFREEMEPGTTLVEWWTREPIAVSPGIPVRRQRRVMTMDQGSAIGAPKGTGPRRFFASCITSIQGIKIGFGNQHPHRVDPDWSRRDQRIVDRARKQGQIITRQEVGLLVQLCNITIHGGDMNDPNYPKSHPKEKVANKRGLDTIRYIVA
jgi:hypothetical protein